MENMWTWEGVHSRSWLERPMISAVGNIADQLLLHHSDLVNNQLVASLPKHAWSRTPDANFHYARARLPARHAAWNEGRKAWRAQASSARGWRRHHCTDVPSSALAAYRVRLRPSVDSGADSSVQPPPTDTACFNSKQAKDRDISKGAAWDISRLRNGCGLWFSCSL